MVYIKYIIIGSVFISCILIGQLLSKKYINRLSELENMKSALNILETKIKFTYEPIPQIFKEISNMMNVNTNRIFHQAYEKMQIMPASTAWEHSVKHIECNLNKEDKNAISSLGKLLGQTDIEGQISQIKITQTFLDKQINEAILEKNKNQKLYSKLGVTIGIAIAIILA